ncbi:hypothetical protein BDL97_11G044400 [Sphagnum fallax]|nr:hypothetical protein BDL97_11G044400 [Sphagnum fallax]
MIQNEEILVFIRVLEWRCVESKIDNERLHYGQFAISPFRSGIQESMRNILINLKKIVTIRDIVFPPSIEVIDTMQYVATFTKAIHLDIEIKIEKDCGYCTHDSIKPIDGYFSIDVCYSQRGTYEAFRKKEEVLHGLGNNNESNMLHFSSSPSKDKMEKEMTFKHVFINQLKLLAKAYNCPVRVDVHTISNLLSYNYDDLMKINNFEKKYVEQILEALKKRF